MQNQRLEHIVQADEAGVRLDRLLAGLESIGSRAEAARLLDAGDVRIEGRRVRKSRLAVAGERIVIERTEQPPAEVEASTIEIDVRYEDDDLLVVDKPAGIVVHPAPGNRSGTLSQLLAGRIGGGDPERPGIVHRLDKDTSGLLLLARNDETLRRLQRALQAREIQRSYTALVSGRPESPTGTIDAPLGRDRRDPEKIGIRDDSPRPAVTHFETLEELVGRTLLEVRLETGRTHQIRVHLAAVGLPVCGDPQYGVEHDLGLSRQFLHASALRFEHPTSGQAIEVYSPLPGDLAAALEQARAAR